MSTVKPSILQQNLDLHHELNVDLFAGGGGWSEGVRMASGRNPDIAINHNDDALSMHRINHPDTRHFVADVFEVDPRTVTQGRDVGHLHASPDCTHHSQAAGGQPRNEKRRALSWVVIRWAGQVSPRVITLENVKQVQQWGPLIAKRCKETGRVVKLDGTVAAKGERVPREFQYLVPDPKRKGTTWRRFVRMLESMGYEVGTQMMRAADYGAGTTRDRLFLHARNDGLPVTFPAHTHAKKPARGQKKWSAAHEHIDFSLPTRSIFDRAKPLAESTMKRIAKGIKRFVIDSPEPFIVQVTQSGANGGGVRQTSEPIPTITTAKGGEFALVAPVIAPLTHHGADRVQHVVDPVPTITCANRGELALAAAVMIQAAHGDGKPGHAQRWGDGCKDAREPAGAITASGGQAVAMAYMMQANDGFNTTFGRDLREPTTTITNSGSQQQLVTAFLSRQFGTSIGHGADEPHGTFTADGGGKSALVECMLSPDDEARALRVAAFLMSYYGTENVSGLDQPLRTITTKDRLALVTVYYHGTPYLIVDIHMRMLEPPELFSAQGMGKHYIITHGHDGRKFTKSDQVRMCGNSVSPYPAMALYTECHKNDDMIIRRAAA